MQSPAQLCRLTPDKPLDRNINEGKRNFFSELEAVERQGEENVVFHNSL